MLKIGHRGASGVAPENTLEAFRKALELGADGVELDVHLLKNGALAVIHDDTLDRTTRAKGPVAEMTREQMHALGVPMLEEVLGVLAGAYCFIEIKHADAALPAAECITQAIKQGYPPDRLWLISFDHAALRQALAVFPALNIGASFATLKRGAVRKTHAMGARGIVPRHRSFSQKQVKEAHALGLKVICWTVNKPTDIAKAQALGVDGIMSDYPERLA